MSSILNDWAHRLERIMTESGGLVRGLQEFIDEAGGHEQTVQLLQEVILEPDLIEQIARRSYGHPNGYDKIIFVSRDSMELPYELRMHVWWAAQPRRSTDIHNHDWEFSSRVLCGRLECREYKLDEGGDLMPKYTYVRSEKGLTASSQVTSILFYRGSPTPCKEPLCIEPLVRKVVRQLPSCFRGAPITFHRQSIGMLYPIREVGTLLFNHYSQRP
jgi:hypothetical protein